MKIPAIAFFTLLSAAFAAATPGAAAVPEQLAARDAGFEAGVGSGEPAVDARLDPLVERIQKALSRKGVYFGPVDGRYGPKTEDAIRAYQRGAGFPIDGLVSEDLANHLETGEKVQDLLKKLDDARRDRIEQARQALMANPKTRHLITDGKDAVADPTRDASGCFDAPTPQCLLAEAAESGKAIPRDEMRDWALKELLVAQARAGLTDAAMTTAQRIVDPRLIMVALRDIAEALAASGFDSEALETARIVPDTVRKAEALTAIARIWTERGKRDRARSALDGAASLIDDVTVSLRKVTFQADLAVLLARNGDEADAAASIKAAQDTAREPTNARQRDAALRHVAATLAEMGRPDEARDVMLSLGAKIDRTPVLVAAANALIAAGDTAAALTTAEEIKEPRYRAVVLADIAGAQARAGDAPAGRATATRAGDVAGGIRMPFARSFAQARIATALIDAGKADGAFPPAVAVAAEIKDDRLRTLSLWNVATAQERAGDAGAADATRALARDAGSAIKSPLSRIWLYADLAVRHAAADERAAAESTFAEGIAVARDVGNAWARTRALSRLAVALIEMADPTQATAAPEE